MSNTEKDVRPVSSEDVMLNMFRGDENPADHIAEPIPEPEVEEEVKGDLSEELIDEDDIIEEAKPDEVVDIEEEVEEEDVVVDESEDEVIKEDVPVNEDVEWDTEEEEVVEDINVFKEISADLGLGEITSKEDLIKEIKDLKTRVEEESKSQGLDNLPAELLNAIEVVKNGGDWDEYKNLSSIDYSNYDSKAFFIESAKQHFIDEDGNLDTESLQDFIDNQDETMIEMQGAAIKKQFVDKQEGDKLALLAQTRAKKELTEAKLKDVLSDFNSFNEFKVNKTHKKKLYEDITSGKAMKEMFYNKYGEYDMSKVVKAYFYYMKGEQMEKFRGQRAKNSAIREVLKDTTNADLRVNGRKVTSNSKVDRPHPFDLMAKKYGMISDE